MSRLVKRFHTIILAALLLLVLPFMFTPPTNRAQTSANPEDSQLRTRTYGISLPVARDFLVKNVTNLRTYGRAWRLKNHDQTTLHCEVPVLVFTDDLRITLQVLADEETRVDVVSSSRVGKGDFGENRRHILQLLAMLDEKFAR